MLSIQLLAFGALGASVLATAKLSPEVVEQYQQYAVWNEDCRRLNGSQSYCKHWQSPMSCHIGNQPCGIVPTTITTSSTTTTQSPLDALCDRYCIALNGDSASYCRNSDAVPVCFGGNQPCGHAVCRELPSTAAPTVSTTTPPPASEGCNDYCQYLNGEESYCKAWLGNRVCQIGNQPCGADVCDAFVSPLTSTPKKNPTPMQIMACDKLCISLNGPASFCKIDMASPVCREGDQPCQPGVHCGLRRRKRSDTTPESTMTTPAP